MSLMRARPFAIRVLLFLAIPLAASACGGAEQAPSTPENLFVSIGIGEPKNLVPSAATESNGASVMNALFTPLVEYDANYRPYEVAAESITTSDNKVWTIKLRDGWKFHNGEPVTADAYINAWNAGAWGPNAHDGNYFFDKIAGYADLNPRDAKTAPKAKKLSGLVKKDNLTFDVTLTDPYVNFKSMLGYTAFYPLPLAAFSDVANNVISPTYQQAPIGQGPFKMKGTWQHDQLVETERYAEYTGPIKPKVAGITYKIYQQQTTQYQDLLAGQLDVVEQIPIESLGSARADLGDRFKQSPASTIQFLAFPTFDKHYSKPEIRRAISMAIDRDEIAKTIFLGSQKSLRSFVSPVVPGYRENSCGEACQYDPVKAKALFDAAGGAAAVGGKIRIAYNVDGGHKPWIDATCNQLRKNLSVECEPNPQPKFSELLTRIEKKDPVGMIRMGWVFDYPAMENYLAPLYSTYGSSNYYGYSNKQFDSLVAAGDRAATPAAATPLYQQAEDILAREMPVIPLRFGQNNFGHSTRVRNVEMDLFFRTELLKLEANPIR
jgi:oligopeptide transport system substrate-binding protein